MPTALEAALQRASPRHAGAHTPWRSALIHGSVLAIWALLLARALGQPGLLTWSVGLAYALYDSGLLLFTWRQTRALDRATAAPGPLAAPRPRLAVLVAAWNEADALPGAIRALYAQQDAPEQVLIADDGSDDATASVLAQHFGLPCPAPGACSRGAAAWPGLCWLRLPHGGKARALNAALTQVDAELVVTVDADTELEPGAIAALRQAFQVQPALVAATGVLRPVCGPGLRGRVLEWFQSYEYLRNFLSRQAWMQVDGLLLISGAFAGYRRSALLTVGGFDPDCLVEDYELIHRLRRHASLHHLRWTTAVVGAARARTEAPGTVRAFLRQRQRWFGGFLQTQYWYREMVGDPRFGAVGTRMLPVKAIDTLQPLFGLSALLVLLAHLVRGDFRVVLPVADVIGAKILLDLAFHAWSVHAWRRWTGTSAGLSVPQALLAALAEPFTFQLLRHTGAALGWLAFLGGRLRWGGRRDPGRSVTVESGEQGIHARLRQGIGLATAGDAGSATFRSLQPIDQAQADVGDGGETDVRMRSAKDHDPFLQRDRTGLHAAPGAERH